MKEKEVAMNLTQLKYFSTICDLGSFSAAALYLHVSQPSLSACIKELESCYGVALFRRHHRGVVPTPEGEKLLDKIHLYIIPRANPEGALLYRRTGGRGMDLNRDYFSLYSVENQGGFRAFRAFQPCLVIDAHELRSRKLSRVMRYEDIQLSSGIAPNADPELYDNNLELLFEATYEMQKLGIRNYFYLDHVSGVEMTTSTRFFVERGAMTVLIECRG
jgi:hypothetical protein